MVDKDIKNAVEEAARLIRDNPELKYYEAIDMAKKMYERREESNESRRGDSSIRKP